MPDNKNQHYVPRFYLKRFSKDKKRLNLYNFKNRKKILNAPLKSQCCRDYFYGKELDIEYALGLTEDAVSAIFNKIDRVGIVPPPWSPDYLIMILFILMQYGRTVYAVDSLNEMTNKSIKQMLSYEETLKDIDLNKVVIELSNATRYSLKITTQTYPFLLDLGCKLLRNLTGEDFVTSDNPVVLYNQLLSFRKATSNHGFATKGLQIFFPIDPKQLIILYDRDVYRVGSDDKIAIDITNVKDIYNLNTLQICSASENIYFLDDRFNTEALHRKAAPYLRSRMANVRVFPEAENTKRRSEIIVMSREEIRIDLKLSFITLRRKAKEWRDSFKKMRLQPVAIVRNPELCKNYDQFKEEIKKGTYKHGDFIKYMNDKKRTHPANE